MRKIMIRAMALVLAAILLLSVVPMALAAENINFGITVTEETDQITVTVAEGNDAAFAELAEENKLFALTIHCGFESAYVTFDGETVESQLDTDEETIRFPVSRGGEYLIVKGEAPEEDDEGQEDDSGNGSGNGSGTGSGSGSGSSSGSSGTTGSAGTSGSSGSSGTSGTSGTSSSTTKTASSAATTVSVQGGGKTVKVQASVSGSVASLLNVSTSQIKAAAGETGSSGMISIDLSGLSKTVDSVKLSANVLNQIAKASENAEDDAQALKIMLPGNITVVFDGASLVELAGVAKNSPVTISVKDYKAVTNLTAAQRQVIGSRGAYDITVSVNGTTVSDIGGRVKTGVPYSLSAGEKAEGLAVYYVDPAGSRELCETGYDTGKQEIFWWTDHLSLYMIDYEEPAAEAATEPEETVAQTQPVETVGAEQTRETEKTPVKVSSLVLWVSVACFLLAIVLVGVLFCLRKKW